MDEFGWGDDDAVTSFVAVPDVMAPDGAVPDGAALPDASGDLAESGGPCALADLLARAAEADPEAVSQTLLAIERLHDLRAPARESTVRDEVSAALALPVGWGLLLAATTLTGMARDDAVLTAAEVAQVMAAWQRLENHCHGGKLTTAGDLDLQLAAERHAAPKGAKPATAAGREASVALKSSLSAGSRLVGLARAAQVLPRAADALSDGLITRAWIEVIVEVTRGLAPEFRDDVEAEAIRLARSTTNVTTIAELRAELQALAARLDPAHAERQAAAGRAERDVKLGRSSKPGCTRLIADLPRLQGMAAWHAVNAAAVAARDAGVRPDGSPEDRLIGQLRADYLIGSLTGLDREQPPTPSGGPTPDAGRGPVPTPDDLADLVEVGVVVGADDCGGDVAPPHDDEPPPPSGDDPDLNDPDPHDAADPAPHAAAEPASLADLLRGWEPPLPVPAPPDLIARSRVSLVVAGATLHGRSDHPGHVPGAGPVDAATVREVASRARYRWLVVDDDTGYLLHRHASAHPPPSPSQEWGTRGAPMPPPLPERISAALRSEGYRPGGLMRAHVEVRDATCIGPTCFHSAKGTQLDHTINFGERKADGTLGTTTCGNLGCVCRAIHQAKTHGGWQLEQTSPGAFVWTTRLGFTVHRRAQPVLPGWTVLRQSQA